jgi:hypothetical protein
MELHMFCDLFYGDYVAAKSAKDAAIYLEVDEEEVRPLSDDSEFHAWFDEEPTDLPPGEEVEPHEDGGQWCWVTTAAKAAKYHGEGRALSEDGE